MTAFSFILTAGSVEVTDPITIRIGVIGAIILAVIVLLRQTDGAVSKWMAERRNNADATADARVNDLVKDVKYLVSKVSLLESKLYHLENDLSLMHSLSVTHEEWDRRVLSRLLYHEPDYPHKTPPPLRLSRTPPPVDEHAFLDEVIPPDTDPDQIIPPEVQLGTEPH